MCTLIANRALLCHTSLCACESYFYALINSINSNKNGNAIFCRIELSILSNDILDYFNKINSWCEMQN